MHKGAPPVLHSGSSTQITTSSPQSTPLRPVLQTKLGLPAESIAAAPVRQVFRYSAPYSHRGLYTARQSTCEDQRSSPVRRLTSGKQCTILQTTLVDRARQLLDRADSNSHTWLAATQSQAGKSRYVRFHLHPLAAPIPESA